MFRLEPLPLKDQKNFYALPHRESACSGAHDMRCYVHKPLLEFEQVMERIGFSLQYIKSGANGHTFYASKPDGTRCAVKIVPYIKSKKYPESIDDVSNPVNVEILMLRLLSQYVTDERCPHIVAPITTFNTPADSFIQYISAHQLQHVDRVKKVSKPLDQHAAYQEFVKKVRSGAFHGTLSVLFSEWADRGDLLDYLKANYLQMEPIVWKVLFFQIVAMLACIQQNFPNFKHNDLKANNILVKSDTSRHKYYKYTIFGKKYMFPNIGLCIKFWDFDFSCIPSVVDNRKLELSWTKDLSITSEKNRYYDLHFFFNSLMHFFPPLKRRSERVPAEVFEFIHSVVPRDNLVQCHVNRETVRVHKTEVTGVPCNRIDSITGEFITTVNKKKHTKMVTEVRSKPTYRMIGKIEYIYPEMLLKHSPYFEEFRKE